MIPSLQHCLLFLVFLIGNNLLIAQNKELSIIAPYEIAGNWTGQLIQLEGGIAKEYYYEITLRKEGNLLKGTGFIRTNEMTGHFDIDGSIDNTKIQLRDLRIVKKNLAENYDWCIKTMQLSFLFREGAFRLEGNWSGNSRFGRCLPGQVFLKKTAIRA